MRDFGPVVLVLYGILAIARSSTQIAAREGLDEDVVISLDGTTVSTDELAQAEKELEAEEEPAAV